MEGLRKKPIVDRGKVGYFLTKDDTPLFYRYWKAQYQIPEKIILCIHGMHSHGDSWILMADRLLQHDLFIGIYAIDLRGHGVSGGPHGDIENYHTLVNDLVEFYQYIRKRHPSIPISVMGESMGGAFSIHLANAVREDLASLILLAPAVQPTGVIRLGMKLELFLAAVINGAEAVNISTGTSKASTDSHLFNSYQSNDPKRLKKRSARYMYQILKMIKGLRHINYDEFVPTLAFMGTKDVLVSKEGTKKLVTKIKSPEKAYYVIPGGSHVLIPDEHAEKYGMYEIIKNWLHKYPNLEDFKYFNPYRFELGNSQNDHN